VHPPINPDAALGHLSESDIAGYLDQDLAPDERKLVTEHLEACDTCRSEIVATARLLGGDWSQQPAHAPERRVRNYRHIGVRVAGLAAAAVLAVVVLVRPGVGPADQTAPGQERFSTEGVEQLTAHAPPAGGSVRRENLRFVWADRGTESYRITVTAEDGRLLWSRALADTTIVPPATVEMDPGERFFWYVDAISNGVVARTGAQSFVVTP
jgi:hypothetical protein